MSPAGRLHAVDPESNETLCGEPLQSLVEFREITWASLHAGAKCRHCLQELSGR
jgi:hypothetical protein